MKDKKKNKKVEDSEKGQTRREFLTGAGALVVGGVVGGVIGSQAFSREETVTVTAPAGQAAHPIMDSPPGTVPFFIFTEAFTSVEHDRGIVLVRAEPPFDELAVFDDIIGQGGGALYTTRDDKFIYLLTPGSYVIQIATGTLELRRIYTPGSCNGMALSPDEAILYVADYAKGKIYKIDIATGQILKDINFGQEEARIEGTYIVGVQGPSAGGSGPGGVSPDGRYFYLTPESVNEGSKEFTTIHLWKFDMLTDTMVGHVDTTEPRGAHMSVFITPDGKYLLTGNYGGKSITMINAETMTLLEVHKDPAFANWHSIHPSPDGKLWVTPMDKGESGYLAVFNAVNLENGIANNLRGYVGPFPRAMDSSSQRVVHMIEFTPDGRFAVFDNMYEEEIYILDVAKMGIAKTLKVGGVYEGRAPRHDWFGANHPMMTPNGKYVGVAIIYDTTYEIYDVETGQRVYKGSVGGGEAISSTHYVFVWWPGYQYGTMLPSRRVLGPTPPNSIDLNAPTSNLLMRADIA